MKKLIIYLSLIATVGFSADVILGRLQDLTWTGTGADRVASFGTADVTDGLVAWWKMDEASWNGTAGEVLDSVAGSYNGTATSATTTNGLINRCGYFNGTSGFVNCGNGAGLSQTNLLTISFWANTPLTQGEVHLCHGNFGASGWYTYSSGNGKISLYYYTSGGQFSLESTSNDIQANTWKYITFIYDTDYVYIYMNGIFNKKTATNGHKLIKTTENFFIGKYVSGTVLAKGLIDDVRIYNRALSSNEVNTIYNKFKP